ncbi:hypothetical protein [Pseudonocardia sp. TRM90224]|uniref:hypothetical protein n=1 Tax=Pseudonocardia sp. TRM90224 TaxID=2812678 RepID=UPI001E3124F8|nr:hypothetical protein [Pseudonocardia sp. TRM90224]
MTETPTKSALSARLPLAAAAAALTVLRAAVGENWTRLADPERSCRSMLDHITLSETFYAGQLVVRPTGHTAGIAAGADARAPLPIALEAIEISATFLSWAVERSGPDVRAFHPWGTSDAAGFAAMGSLEVLVHTFDITRALGVDWLPPDDLSEPVVGRLFPLAPEGHAAGEAMLWCTGRIALPGLPRKAAGDWQWDGRVR